MFRMLLWEKWALIRHTMLDDQRMSAALVAKRWSDETRGGYPVNFCSRVAFQVPRAPLGSRDYELSGKFDGTMHLVNRQTLAGWVPGLSSVESLGLAKVPRRRFVSREIFCRFGLASHFLFCLMAWFIDTICLHILRGLVRFSWWWWWCCRRMDDMSTC